MIKIRDLWENIWYYGVRQNTMLSILIHKTQPFPDFFKSADLYIIKKELVINIYSSDPVNTKLYTAELENMDSIISKLIIDAFSFMQERGHNNRPAILFNTKGKNAQFKNEKETCWVTVTINSDYQNETAKDLLVSALNKTTKIYTVNYVIDF